VEEKGSGLDENDRHVNVSSIPLFSQPKEVQWRVLSTWYMPGPRLEAKDSEIGRRKLSPSEQLSKYN
jgi:hypothetical protein